MSERVAFSAGNIPDLVPKGDAARQAVDSLRGYAYQVLASALNAVVAEKTEMARVGCLRLSRT